MTIYRYKGKWKAEIWVGKRRVESKSGFLTKSTAQKWHDTRIAEFHVDSTKLDDQKRFYFEDLLERYVQIHLPTVKPGTRTRYFIDINQRIRTQFEGRPLDKIEPFMFEQFRSEIMKGLSAKSVNNCCDTLYSMFRKAVEWGMLDKNPCRLKQLKLPESKYNWWDDMVDVQRFLAVARTCRYFATYRLALDCGLRLGEIVGLSKQDVDFGRCQIHIHRQWLDKEKCYGPPKNSRERFVSFDPESDLGDVLRSAIAASPDSEMIFVTRTGRRVGARKLSGEHFQRLIRISGVKRIKFHDMRHTFASWYMITQDDIWSLKGVLGHADIQTSQKYAHLSSRYQKVSSFAWSASKDNRHAPARSTNGLQLVTS